jgi:CheY-like chemotaxis protein
MKMREYKAGIMTGILILEDDLSIADLLQEALEAQGYSVIGIAGTVAEAMKIARQHQPDVTIADVRLANGDLGTEFSPTFVRAMIALSCFPAGAPTTRYWPRPMAMP